MYLYIISLALYTISLAMCPFLSKQVPFMPLLGRSKNKILKICPAPSPSGAKVNSRFVLTETLDIKHLILIRICHVI